MNKVEIASADILLRDLRDLLPFKGKGEAARQRDESWQNWQAVNREMQLTAAEFRSQFSSYLPLRLVVMRGASLGSALRWRRTEKGQQTTMQLCSEQGAAVLGQLPLKVRAAFLEYDIQATALNAARVLYQGKYAALADYVEKLDAWEQACEKF